MEERKRKGNKRKSYARSGIKEKVMEAREDGGKYERKN